MSRSWLLSLVAVAGCKSGRVSLGAIEGADDIAELCAASEPEVMAFTVEFPATEPGCAFGEGGNLPAEDAVITARTEQLDALALPDGAVVCDLSFDFEGVTGGQGTPMVYDDNFFFNFNDVILAASYGPMVEEMVAEEELFYLYDWGDLRGYGFTFDDTIPTWCIGEDAGLADCEIPPPETEGVMSLDFDAEIATELSFRAVSEERYDFSFITFGDNDSTDCFHEDFSFVVEVPYVER